jgi:hypothetical protein
MFFSPVEMAGGHGRLFPDFGFLLYASVLDRRVVVVHAVLHRLIFQFLLC